MKDQKTGFCLTDAFTSDLCGRNQPELTTVSEGISVGGSDKYLGYLEGQYLVLDPTTMPSGDYLLVKPTIAITNSCPASIDCPAPPADPSPATSPPARVIPAAEPEQVPEVPAADFAPATAGGRLVFRAIQRSLATPRRLRTTCVRRDVDAFACNSTWRGTRSVRWRGRIRVWYRVSGGRLSWFYDLVARRSPGGRLVVRHARRGSASRAVFAASGALFCARSR